MSYIKRNFTSNHVSIVDTTSFTKQTISTSIVGYNGTEVTYTPTSNAASVVYEVNYTLSWDPSLAGSYPQTRVQYSTDNGSSWTDINDTFSFEGWGDWYNNATEWIQMSYVYTIPVWSGERKIRLAGRTWQGNTLFTIGRQAYASNFGNSGADACPHVLIYSVEQ